MSIGCCLKSRCLRPAMLVTDAVCLTACGACMSPIFGLDPAQGRAIGISLIASKYLVGSTVQLIFKNRANVAQRCDYCPFIAYTPLVITSVGVGVKVGCSPQLLALTTTTCCVGTAVIWGIGVGLSFSREVNSWEITDPICATLYEGMTGQLFEGQRAKRRTAVTFAPETGEQTR